MPCQYSKCHYIIISMALEIKDNSDYIRWNSLVLLIQYLFLFVCFNIQYLGQKWRYTELPTSFWKYVVKPLTWIWWQRSRASLSWRGSWGKGEPVWQQAASYSAQGTRPLSHFQVFWLGVWLIDLKTASQGTSPAHTPAGITLGRAGLLVTWSCTLVQQVSFEKLCPGRMED